MLFEDEAKREENVKHFRMSDGSYRAQIFTEPVHYYDETEGKYLAIDNTLCDCPACLEKEDDFDGYENRQSDVRVKFGKRTNGKLFTLEKDGYKVEWKLLGKRDKRLLCDALNDSCAFLPNGKQRSAETKLSDEIRYNDIAPGTDLQYILSPKRIKENIIVRERQDSYEYKFELKLKNLNVELSEDGQRLELFIQKIDEESGALGKETIFTIPMPYMFDADGKKSGEVTYELERLSGNKFIFSVIADENWINAEGRAFPVTIDPVIETKQKWDSNFCLSRKVTNQKNNKGEYIIDDSGYNCVGDDGYGMFRSYLKFKLPNFEGRKILEATLSLYQIGFDGNVNNPGYFDIHKVTSNWNENTTFKWDNCPSFDNKIYSRVRYSTKKYNTLKIDITKLAKEWENNPNYGLMMKDSFEQQYCDFFSFHNEKTAEDDSEIPQLTINYVENRCRVSDEYQVNNIKRAGTHMVDLWTGRNRLVHEDAGFEDNERLSLSVSHVYNILDKAASYIKTSRNNYTPDLGVGRGWKLNLQQFLFKINTAANGYTDSIGFLYIDQNGDEIVFSESKKWKAVYDGAGNVTDVVYATEYLDEQGKKLRCFETDGELRIKDDKETTLYFRNNELYKIIDRNGDYILLEKGACDGKISKVSDSTGHWATFAYNSLCCLNKITFSDGKVFSYTYDSFGRLTKIGYPDGSESEFHYGEGADSYSLTSVRDCSGYRLKIGYTNGKATSLKDFASNKEISAAGVTAYTAGDGGVSSYSTYKGVVYEKEGKEIVIKYENNTTKVITENGYADNYQWSDSGFCECIYQTKNELNASANKKYVTDVSKYKNFNLFDTYEVRPLALAKNFLKNGSFEGLSDCLEWVPVDETSANRYYGVSVDGNYSLKIQSSYTQKRQLCQTVYASQLKLSKGEGLLLSGYAKADSLPTSGANTSNGTTQDKYSTFSLLAKLIYTDGTSETTEVNFDPFKTDWQFAVKGIVVNDPSKLQRIEVYIDYSYNNGAAYFDKISLTKGNAVYTKGLPRFYTNRDMKTYDISELVGIEYKDNDHIFHKYESVSVKDRKKNYLDILAMQQNPDLIIIDGEVHDGGAEPKRTMLTFKKEGESEKKYSLFDIEYAASGITEIVNKSGTIRLYKRRDDNVERTEFISDDKASFAMESEYDASGRLIKETDFRGVVKEYTYSNASKYNNVTKEKTHYANGVNKTLIHRQSYTNDEYIRNTYDERGYDEDGSELYTTTNYNSSSENLSSVKLPNGQTVQYSYDKTNTYLLGITTSVSVRSTPGGSVRTQTVGVNYSYNLGYLTSIDTGANGVNYEYAYDGFGNAIKTYVNGEEVLEVKSYKDSTYSSTDESTYDYEEVVLGNGTAIKEIYNKKGGLICRKIKTQTGTVNGEAVYGEEVESYRVYYKTDEHGEELDEIDRTIDKMPAIDLGTPTDAKKWYYHRYNYKENGEFDYSTLSSSEGGVEYRSELDEGGRVIKEKYTLSGLSLNHSYQYEYEKNGEGEVIPDNRITEIRMYDKAEGTSAVDTLTLKYDELGRVTKEGLKPETSSSAEYFYESYGYKKRFGKDSCNNTYQEGSTNYLSTIQYRCKNVYGTESADYDKNGNIKKITDANKSVTYSYDDINRLVSEENGFIGKNHYYSYDADGNLGDVYTQANSSKTWEKKESYHYASGNKNRLVSITEYDMVNNTSREVSIAGSYDALGNPGEYRGNVLEWKRGRVLTKYGNIATYRYDSDNIRVEKQEGGRTHQYYTVDGKIVGERIMEGSETKYYRYLYAGEKVIGLTSESGRYYYQYGTSGNIVRVCKEDGSIAARYEYDAWGKCKVYNEEGIDITENTMYNSHIGRVNPFRYKGYYYDEDTKLYYLQSRYYDAEIRRFINADNVGVVSGEYLTTIGGQNLYSYCLNNPVNHADPSGHLIGAIVGLVVSLVFLGLAVYGLIKAGQAFWKEPSWLNLLFLVIAVVDVALSLIAVWKAFKGLLAAVKVTKAKKFIKTSSTQKVNMSVQEYLDKYVPKQYHEQVLKGFGDDATVSIAKRDIIVYRYYSGSNPKGYWITPYQYSNPISALALDTTTNSAEHMTQFILKKGTLLIEGKVVPLNGQIGGGYQFYIWNLESLL